MAPTISTPYVKPFVPIFTCSASLFTSTTVSPLSAIFTAILASVKYALLYFLSSSNTTPDLNKIASLASLRTPPVVATVPSFPSPKLKICAELASNVPLSLITIKFLPFIVSPASVVQLELNFSLPTSFSVAGICAPSTPYTLYSPSLALSSPAGYGLLIFITFFSSP